MDITNYLVSILISLAVGLIGFVAAYKVFDWLTPGMWELWAALFDGLQEQRR